MDNSKKVGILSLYYNNSNYGGVLQAYALCRVLNDMGVNAEQVQIRRVFHVQPHKRIISDYLNLEKYIQKVKIIVTPYIEKRYQKLHEQEWNKRVLAVKRFRDRIPHSERVYTDDDIAETLDSYDTFITGSDQVWGITQYSSPYLLNFVPKGKRKFSYAASMGYTSIDEKTKKIYEETLKGYCAVSVREVDAVDMLSSLTDKQVVQTLDPTLLLDREQWDEIVPERKITEPYLLCYFLGDDKTLRKRAVEFARVKGLKIVTFPHCPTTHHNSDNHFGDYRVYHAGPDDFVSYIKYSNCVFTDSFHGTVFSILYEKPFLVFNRKGEERMISRISSLLSLFHIEKRLVDPDMASIISMIDEESLYQRDDYEKMKAKSIKYIMCNLYGDN